MPTPEEVLAQFTAEREQANKEHKFKLNQPELKNQAESDKLREQTNQSVPVHKETVINPSPSKTVVTPTKQVQSNLVPSVHSIPVSDQSPSNTPGILPEHVGIQKGEVGNLNRLVSPANSVPLDTQKKYEQLARDMNHDVDPNRKSRGPENPAEIEIKSDRRADLPHVPTTGPRLTNLNIQPGQRMQVPPQFMEKIAVILKDSGADSMSQEKSLARIAELIYPHPIHSPNPSEMGRGIPSHIAERNQNQQPNPAKIKSLPE